MIGLGNVTVQQYVWGDVRPLWYVGSPGGYIELWYEVLSPDKIYLHSHLCLRGGEIQEEFLDEVWERDEAIGAAESMVSDAVCYLIEQGYPIDAIGNSWDFVAKLRQELTVGLH